VFTQRRVPLFFITVCGEKKCASAKSDLSESVTVIKSILDSVKAAHAQVSAEQRLAYPNA
jgi:hypothetical protein